MFSIIINFFSSLIFLPLCAKKISYGFYLFNKALRKSYKFCSRLCFINKTFKNLRCILLCYFLQFSTLLRKLRYVNFCRVFRKLVRNFIGRWLHFCVPGLSSTDFFFNKSGGNIFAR